MRWSEMAVLTRTGADAHAIAVQLRDSGIPVQRSSRGRLASDDVVTQWFNSQNPTALVVRVLDELSFDSETGTTPTALRDAALEASALEPDITIEAFNAWLTLAEDVPDTNAVTCTTIHASKGLEWHLVFIAAADVPARSRAQISDEEHRVLHVGLTRTRDQLIVTWAKSRSRSSSNAARVLHPVLAAMQLDDLDAPPVPAPDTIRQAIRSASNPDARRQARRQRLETWRDDQARIARVNPEAILPTRALEAIVRHDPAKPLDLMADTGMGPVRAARLSGPIQLLLAEVS
jgi:superfamily I DNA/RNA helicase